jgi:predicted DNA-binding transcriptional regulator YafY
MPTTLFDKLSYLDYLISTRATGTPEQLAQKLKVTERTVYNYLNIMKGLGAPVSYSNSRCTYFYQYEGKLIIKFMSIPS